MNVKEMTKAFEEVKLKIKELEELINREDKKGVWVPSINERYWFISNQYGDVCFCEWLGNETDLYRLCNNNIFKTEEEAQRYADIDYKYKKLVVELNQENPIDWEDEEQFKYSISYKYDDNDLATSTLWVSRVLGVVCCTNSYILQKAIDLIGEDDLIWYIKR